MVALPILGFAQAMSLTEGLAGQIQVMGLELTTIRLDGLSRIFGIFTLAENLPSRSEHDRRQALEQPAHGHRVPGLSGGDEIRVVQGRHDALGR